MRKKLLWRTLPSMVCSLLLAGILLLMLTPPETGHADGGAPNLAYVGGAGRGVGVIDIAQQRLTSTFAVAGDPSMLLLNPTGSLLYVTQPAVGRVVALASKTGQIICGASFPGHPTLLALSVDASVLYVAGLNEMPLLALNAQTCEVLHTWQAPEPVHWLATTLANATGDIAHTQLWLAGPGAVSILDDQGQLSDTIPLAGDPQFLSLPGSLTAYVATRQGSVIALDMQTHRPIATLLTGGVFGAMDYNAVTQEIYLPDQRKHQIDVLTPVVPGPAVLPREPAYTLPVDGVPQAIAITNDGQLGFIALADGRVAMLDVPAHEIVRAITVGGNPHFIITGQFPPPQVPSPIPPATSPPPWLIPGLIIAGLLLVSGVGSVFWLSRRRQTRSVKS